MNDKKNFRSFKTELDEIALIKKSDLSVCLQISVSYIDKLMAEEALPHYKIGKSVRFKKNEVAAFLERRRRL